MLRRQPLDPQPADVHADGKAGRGVPSFESPSEYITGVGGGVGAGGAGRTRNILRPTSHRIKTVRGAKAGKHPARDTRPFASVWE